MPEITPSKNPQKESSQFTVAAIAFTAASLFIWFFGILGVAFGIRAALLSYRIQNQRYMMLSIAAVVVSLLVIVYSILR